MTLVNSRIPTQIATVANDYSITWNTEALRHVLERANGNNIKIVVVIGKYQIGKSSLISSITRNQNHVIGEGWNETTNGATIDGPYTIGELINEGNLIQEHHVPDNESIFFVDIEGYGGSLRGNHNQQFSFFSKICSPFVGISSCVIFLCDKNEDRSSLDQVLTALNLDCFNINNNQFNSQIVLMNLIRDVNNYLDINYLQPDNNNYTIISNLLVSNWQRIRLQNFDFNQAAMFSKPLPLYNTDSYNIGLNFVINDLVNILINTNVRYITNDPNIISDLFSSLCSIIHNFHQSFPQSFTYNFYTQLYENKMQQIFNDQYIKIIGKISAFSESIKNDQSYTNLVQETISNSIRENAFENLRQDIIDQGIDEIFLEYEEIRNSINNFKVNFEQLISSKSIEIISFKIRSLLDAQKEIIKQNLMAFSEIIINDHNNDLIYQNISNLLEINIYHNIDTFIDQCNIPALSLQIPDVISTIDDYKMQFNEPINENTTTIITRKIKSKLALLSDNITHLLETYANRMKNSICEELNHDNMSADIRRIINLDTFITNNIPQKTLQIPFVNQIINDYRENVECQINEKTKEIIIDKIIYYRARLIACISLTINSKIDELKKAKLLKYIPNNEEFVNSCFQNVFIEISDILFDDFISRKRIQYISELVEMKNALHDGIAEEIKALMPELMSSLVKKKNLQIFINILIVIAVALTVGVVVSNGIGAGIVASVTTATAAAAIVGTSSKIINIVLEYTKLKNILADKEIDHIRNIIDSSNIDIDSLKIFVEQMEEEEIRRIKRMEENDENENSDELNLHDILSQG